MPEQHAQRIRTPIQRWADLTRSYTRGLSDEQIINTALACVEAERLEGVASVWHQASMVTKTRCCCVPCSKGLRVVR